MPNDPVKQQILEKADIVDIVSGYLRLQNRGGRFFGICPFHKEKTPSFTVQPDRGFFHCFGCGKGGNAIDFIMGVENLTYGEARSYLATKFGIPIQSFSGKKRDHEEIDRYQVMDMAAQLYSSGLQKNKIALDYLKSREITAAHINQFSLGYAPQGWDNLFKALTRKQYPPKVLEELGLVIPRKDSSGFYDRFRHRIMFPIRNTLGRVIAFGGRALDPADNAKYLNTNDTSLFNKSKVLYLLDQAKNVLKDKGALLVEGYMDAIALHINGFNQAVANLGTALTKDHAAILQRYTTDFTLLYDGDNAGKNAAMKGVETFLEMGYCPKVVLMPDGKDPDDFVKSEGKEALQTMLDHALDGFSFYLQRLKSRHDVTSSRGKTDIVNDIMPLFAKINEPIMTQDFIRTLATHIGSDIGTLEVSIRQKLQKARTFDSQSTPEIQNRPVQETSDPQRQLKEAVIRLLALHHKLIVLKNNDNAPIKVRIPNVNLEEIQSLFSQSQQSRNILDIILQALLRLDLTGDERKEAVRLSEIFPENQVVSSFINITDKEPMPTDQKDIAKMQTETLSVIHFALQKKRQVEIVQQSNGDPKAALQALNDLILKKEPKEV
jgi:DNA primase